jgi:hypothetical protein
MTHEAAQEQEVLEEVQARLLDAEARGGGQGYAGNAIRDELELIGRQMGSGTFTIP